MSCDVLNDIRQDEGQDDERCEHGQCGACSLELEALRRKLN